jgi:hypothetical protein
MDIDPAYIDVTIRRWQKMTGRKAVHAVSQMTFDNLEQGAVIPSEKTGDLKVD